MQSTARQMMDASTSSQSHQCTDSNRTQRGTSPTWKCSVNSVVLAVCLCLAAAQVDCRQQDGWQHLMKGKSRQLMEPTPARQGVAICAVVENPEEDLREWMEHHRNLGVSRFYIMDSNSSRPSGREIADYITTGLVDFFYSSDLATKTRFPQLYVYDICLTRFGAYHQWMAFLEPDEYLVLQPPAAAERLPEFLQGYDEHGGLAVNLRIFGSSGFKTRPKGGVLQNYVKCLPEQHPENRKIRTIVNTALDPAVHMLSASHMKFKEGFSAVDEAKRQLKTGESTSSRVNTAMVAVHKYPLRVAPAQQASSVQGSDVDSKAHFQALDQEATKECLAGKRVAQQDRSNKHGM